MITRNTRFVITQSLDVFATKPTKMSQSCISEAQKYQGALYKEKKPKSQQQQRHAPSQTLATVEAPPQAPSPPAAAYPVNVFDYLVGEQSPNAAAVSQDSVRYGAGPMDQSLERFDSGLNSMTQNTQDTGLGYSTTLRTPGASRSQLPNGDKNSEKKRKRANVDGLSIVPPRLSGHAGQQPNLHSGLTGGLNRLLSNEPRDYEASPLSPKKRSRHGKEEKSSKRRSGDDEDRHHKKHRQHESELDSRSGREVKAIEGSKELQRIEYPVARKSSAESNSEFFLSLINRDHLSSKGQSIWGALKMFREGLPGDLSSKDTKEQEEKKLFRGLRMRINDAGEIVLFSRPELEVSGSSGLELQKR